MKVSEIILEADPVKLPNFGTAGQPYNVNYNMSGAKTPNKGTASVKGTASRVATPKIDLKTRPFDLLNQQLPDKVPKVKGATAAAIKGFAAKSIYKVLKGTALMAPLLIWIDDMSSITVMFESGYFNSYGNRAGEAMQQMRTAHTQLLFSRYATALPAWWLGVGTSSLAIRLAMGLIPGVGWLATLTSAAAGIAVTAMLQTDTAQKIIVTHIIDNIPGLGDAVYETAKVVGGIASSASSGYFSRLKNKFLNSKSTDNPSVSNTSVKPATSNTPKSAAPVQPNIGPSMADLAKELN